MSSCLYANEATHNCMVWCDNDAATQRARQAKPSKEESERCIIIEQREEQRQHNGTCALNNTKQTKPQRGARGEETKRRKSESSIIEVWRGCAADDRQ